ncbi:MAG TPA: M4 family metallopeptidase, partial [Xanthobacteraceae bacterium]|nr:M4 family metallopeptidase [Xanthobacteraceae bacterium]
SVAPGAAALAGAVIAAAPGIQVFDCQQRQSLPGRPAADPQASNDPAVSTIYATTQKVAEFYKTVFGRNSVDNNGLDLVSSVHYQQNYDNAFWNGQQMVYGDGDGTIFTQFFKSSDVIGHELTHGVTQYESGLLYEGESGALNESISDAFGAVFNQWVNGWDVSKPQGWLIGAGIMGSQASADGKTCLRDMNDPGGAHCLAPQPASYKQFDPSGDVHYNSGIPNKAFALFAQAVGGNGWERALKVWYSACTNRKVSSGATFTDFAAVTIEAASAVGSDIADQLKQAWAAVDLPLGAGT